MVQVRRLRPRDPDARPHAAETVMFKQHDGGVVLQQIELAERGLTDMVLPANQLKFDDQFRILPGDGHSYVLDPWAFKQLARIMKFTEKALATIPIGPSRGSRSAVVERVLAEHGDKSICVRFRPGFEGSSGNIIMAHGEGTYGTVVAILVATAPPPRVSEIMGLILPIARRLDLGIQFAAANLKRTHVRCLSKNSILTLPGVGGAETDSSEDHLALGMHWTMSNVGFGDVKADLCAWRKVCSNGLVVQTDNAGLFKQRIQGIDMGVLEAQVIQAFESMTMKRTQLEGALRAMMELEVPDMEKGIRDFLSIQTSTQVPPDLEAEAIKATSYYRRHTAYGVLQAITRAAQNKTKYNANLRLQAETLAGRYLMMYAGASFREDGAVFDSE